MSANPNSQSKINMTESRQSEHIPADNEQALRRLAWAIEASIGQFKLLLACCNYTSLRSLLVKRLQELVSVPIRILELEESETTLYARIQAELHPEPPNVLTVIGLETVGDLDRLLISTNQVREEFQKNFQFPLVIWINDEVLKKLLYLAPDFESWSITTAFTVAPEEFRNFIKQKAQQWLANELKLTKKASLELKADLESSRKELLNFERLLEPELAADLEILLGAAEYRLNNKDAALKHYLKGWRIWRRTNNIERQAKLTHDITFCYYQRAIKHRDIKHRDWQRTRRYLKQCLKVSERSARPDLVVNSFLNLGRFLRKLQEWEQWEPLAKKALRLHQTENKPIELAQDYGFLAEVALEKKRWTEAENLACKSLQILANPLMVGELPDETVLSYARSLYRFILAQAQQHLKQSLKAIRNLEIVMEEGSPEYDTYLYLDILSNLQKLYFEQKEYLKAFEIKLERQSIEQQYGLRAFVGAGQIQPRKQAQLVGALVESEETVAPEIKASGRQLDVERLLERIGRNDCKLIVIHGQSGVGKSSLVNGGLMPALKQKAIGTQDVLPVAMRVYTNWVGELGRLLAEALANLSIRGSKEAETHRGRVATLDSKTDILLALQQSESRNLRTVLIFDQFEEFFFVYPVSARRRQFFAFLGECLNILSVKAVLSLREDYLHYLLECNRLDSMKIIGNDILTKNVLYSLGNFSPADTKEIIVRLTESSNFQLEPTLIKQLAQDLAGELGEVRPIELQVVGAQLQTEDITTLTKYRNLGTKKELVKRYLNEVVEDCGAENQQAAELVLYLLTDERGTRPLKTRVEIERDLQALSATNLTAAASSLDLILQIFVKSGLVLLLPENPNQRYQLVHDYLAVFIRQQQEPKLKELMAELERERTQRKIGEEKLNRFLKRALMGSIGAVVVFASLAAIAWNSAQQAKEQKKQAEISEIKALTNSSETFFVSGQTLDALIEALKAGGKLKLDQEIVPNDSRIPTIIALQQAVYLQPEENKFREHNRLEGHSSSVTSVAFSPDGKTLASASFDNTLKLWDVATGKQLKTLSGHSSSVTSVAFSPDGKTLASASVDTTLKLWDVATGKQLKTLSGHSSWVTSVAFSPDGKTLASASFDKTLKLWDVATGKQLKTLSGHSSSVTSVAFSPDGKTLASASDDGKIILRNFDLNDLLVSGCSLLNDFLAIHPQVLEDLKECQTPSILVKAAPVLVTQGEELAKQEDIDGAIAKFRKAQEWNHNLNFDPQTKAQQLAKLGKAQRLVLEADNLVQQHKIKEAITAYNQAQKLDPKVEISAVSGNALCWDGSLRGYAKEVMFACEKAVQLTQYMDGSIRDSRGLARALTGNTKGAIEDFQAFIARSDNKEQKSQRQRWITALSTGKNPFTPEELKRLENY